MDIDRAQLHAFSASTQWQQLKGLMEALSEKEISRLLEWSGQSNEWAVNQLARAKAVRDFTAFLVAQVEQPLTDAAPQETYFETITMPRSIKELKEWQKSKRPTADMS